MPSKRTEDYWKRCWDEHEALVTSDDQPTRIFGALLLARASWFEPPEEKNKAEGE